jgi:hypothetical protein
VKERVNYTFCGLVQVGIVEDDKGAVSAQLEGYLFETVCTELRY